MDGFTCPECEKFHLIADYELYCVYNDDGEQTEFDCEGCGKPLIITSIVVGWKFETEINE